MSGSIKWRGLFVLICLVFASVALAPTFMKESLPSWWTDNFSPIQKGLDLQGGIHLVLGVVVEKAVESHLDGIADQVEDLLREQDIIFKRVERKSGERIVVTVYDDEAGAELDKLMSETFGNLEPMTLETEGGYIQKNFRLSDVDIEETKELAIRQALQTLRSRIDEFGVSEPVLQRQAGNRILIQLPGIDDPKRAIDLIGRRAQLEFKMVLDDADPQEAIKGNLPRNGQLLYMKKMNRQTGVVTETPIVVESRTALTGEYLTDARVRISSQYNDPYVSIQFDAAGAKRFEQITGANKGRRMAIVLDDTVHSAPVIQDRIGGGSAQISGSFSEQEATDLAIVLRSGSLPAPVEILENRTVGPSLGQDSIDKGIMSVQVGGLLVIGMMLFYYRLSGLVANIALICNLIFILALLSLLGATLTLPGIAGIVLTIGMAVDANVLIFERIREELRSGRPAAIALESGFGKAFRTIVDANITTLIAALVLFQFGTGPVKGFAVTLSIGILCSLFTAVFVSRVIFDFFLGQGKARKFSI
jgi:preprotein translocase subunit SecD